MGAKNLYKLFIDTGAFIALIDAVIRYIRRPGLFITQ